MCYRFLGAVPIIMNIDRYSLATNLKWKLRYGFLGKIPSLYQYTYCLKPANRRLFVDEDTDITISGFPKSANTFAVVAFQNTQDVTYKISHHQHVISQIVKSVKLLPTVTLIRDPVEAVSSLILRLPGLSITSALRTYINYYESIKDYVYESKVILAPFELVIEDFSSIIGKVNRVFGADFKLFEHDEKFENKIFSEIEKIENSLGTTNEYKVSKPNPKKEALKTDIRTKVIEHSLTSEAEDIYSNLKGAQW